MVFGTLCYHQSLFEILGYSQIILDTLGNTKTMLQKIQNKIQKQILYFQALAFYDFWNVLLLPTYLFHGCLNLLYIKHKIYPLRCNNTKPTELAMIDKKEKCIIFFLIYHKIVIHLAKITFSITEPKLFEDIKITLKSTWKLTSLEIYSSIIYTSWQDERVGSWSK